MFQFEKIVVCALALLLLASCKKPQEPDGYRVVSYDGRTHEWTIIRTGTFDGKFLRKRMVLLCESFKWGQRPSVTGEEACHLVVGHLITFTHVFEMPGEVLSITEGEGDDRVMQQFKILKYEVMEDR